MVPPDCYEASLWIFPLGIRESLTFLKNYILQENTVERLWNFEEISSFGETLELQSDFKYYNEIKVTLEMPEI